MSEYHTPVLLDQSVSALVTSANGTYVDATFGGGGHTAGILSRLSGSGRVIAFDRDSDAIKNRIDDGRLILVRDNFRFIRNHLLLLEQREGIPSKVDGILADLGVSSHQFDTAERGFSFRFDAPLDMRMNTEGGQTAADFINSAEEQDIERVLRMWGEVDGSRKMASLIVKARNSKEILSTGELSSAISSMLPKGAEHKVLAKVFQALRIEVNQEMRSLEKFLQGAAESLKEDGRFVVITYHSLEDRMVKNFFKCGNVEGRVEKDIYGRVDAPLEAVERKPILPTEEEIAGNTRARSAKLRVARRKKEDGK